MQEHKASVPIGNSEHLLHLITVYIFPLLTHSLSKGNVFSHMCLFTKEAGPITSCDIAPNQPCPSSALWNIILPCSAPPPLHPFHLHHGIDPHPSILVCSPYIYWQRVVGLSCNKKIHLTKSIQCKKHSMSEMLRREGMQHMFLIRLRMK